MCMNSYSYSRIYLLSISEKHLRYAKRDDELAGLLDSFKNGVFADPTSNKK